MSKTISLFLAFATLAACGSNEQNRPNTPIAPPHLVAYKIVEEWSIPNGGFVRLVVISDTAGNEKSLRALGEELRYDTREDRNTFISVFTDARAVALRRDVIRDAASKKDVAFYDRHFVAQYTRNINTGVHELAMTPKGLNGPQIDVSY